MRQPVLSADEVAGFVDEVFPQQAGVYRVLSGGTVSGPTMFAIADCAFYVAVLAMIGREALTVTTTLTINFLRKPAATDLRAEARILKLGRTLATGDVLVYSEGVADPVAHAAVTYAVPAARA